MEPLRLELDEQTLLRLVNASETIKDEVENLHTKLMKEVRLFYAQKQEELEKFAKMKLDAPQPSSSTSVSQSSSKCPKSIVKRRPSTVKKHVTFSQSPPQVELFSKIEEMPYEDEEDEENERIAIKPARYSKLRYSPLPKLQKSHPKKKSSSKPPSTHVVYTPRAEAENSPISQDTLFEFEDIIDSHREDSWYSEERDPNSHLPVIMESSLESSSEASYESCLDTNPGSDEDFFYVENHQSAGPQNIHPSAEETDDLPAESESEALPFVGSAPVEIKANQWGLRNDDRASDRIFALIESERNEHLGFSMRRLRLPDSMDPSNMSFSQRMEWEQFRKLHHGEVA